MRAAGDASQAGRAEAPRDSLARVTAVSRPHRPSGHRAAVRVGEPPPPPPASAAVGPSTEAGQGCGPPRVEPGVLWSGWLRACPHLHPPNSLPGVLPPTGPAGCPAARPSLVPLRRRSLPGHTRGRGACTCFYMFIHFFTPRRFWSYTQAPMVPSREGHHCGESCRQVEGGDQHFPGGGVGPGRELGQVGWEGEMEGGRGAWGRAPGGQTHLVGQGTSGVLSQTLAHSQHWPRGALPPGLLDSGPPHAHRSHEHQRLLHRG